jgi:hypothetical protein
MLEKTWATAGIAIMQESASKTRKIFLGREFVNHGESGGRVLDSGYFFFSNSLCGHVIVYHEPGITSMISDKYIETFDLSFGRSLLKMRIGNIFNKLFNMFNTIIAN